MADKLKYSTTQPTLPGLRTDDFVLGTGDGNYGPTSTTSYLNGFTAPEGGYVVYTLGLSNTPIGWVASNDTELIDISRHLGNTTLDIKTAKVYLADLTDTWVFNSTPNNIVTDSLVFDMSIKNLTSYPDSEVNVYDISGEGNDGTLVNGITRNSNGWLLFDGVDDYIEPNNTFSFPGEFTVTCVFKQDTASERSFLGRVEGSTKLIFLSNYNIFFRMVDGGSAVNFSIGYGSSNLGKWNYITATRDGDGVIKASLNGNPYTVNAVRTGTFEPNLIGKNNSGQYWDGGISNMRIYDRSFTETEIKQNYYGGPIVTDGLVYHHDAGNLVSYEPGAVETFSMTGSYIGNLINDPQYTPYAGGALLYDAADTYIEVDSFAGVMTESGPTSYSFWFYSDSNNNSGGALHNKIIFSMHTSSGGNILRIGVDPGGNGMFYSDPATGDQRVGYSTNYNNNKWYNFAFSRANGGGNQDTKYYINGEEIAPYNWNGRTDPPYSSVSRVSIGQEYDGGTPTDFFGGYISMVSIYDKQLSDAEVQQNFEAHRSRFGV